MDQEPILSDQFLNPQSLLKSFGIKEGINIADFGTGGTGSGYLIFKAAEMVGKTKGIIYALDVKKSIIDHLTREIATRHIPNIKPIWTDLELVGHNPIPAHSIDLVIIINMLYYSNKPRSILEEACRELKPNGRIIIIDWKKHATPFGPPIHERVDLEKLKEIAYSLELNKIQELEPGPYHFGIIFRK